MIGQELDGRYRILRRLGTGGMGEVFLAEHLVFKRLEAIKIVKSRLARNEGYLARFRREARATNRVQHPNIVSVYDFGRLPDGRLYLTMELADGPSLHQLLGTEGRFPVARAVHVLRQLATAIEFAHGKGVIHRDLKPDNLVLVERDGDRDHVKILDFGVAKIIAPEYLESAAISREGELFGTPAYIAPEQIRGIRDDPRIDIYAFGCIAFELLTGETPFVGRPMDVLEAHMSEPPQRPSQRISGLSIPPQLDELVVRCLAKEGELRPQTGGEIAAELERMPLQVALPSRRAPRSDPITLTGAGFDDGATEEGLPEAIASGSLLLATTDLFPTRVEREVRARVRELAELLCDTGATNPELLVLLAEVHQVEQDLHAVDGELDELGRRAAYVAQTAREREASLRFALGELRFNRDGNDDASVERAIDVLRQRLELMTRQAQRESAEITDRQIALTAARAGREEEVFGLYVELERLGCEVAAVERGRDERVAQLDAEIRRLRGRGDR